MQITLPFPAMFPIIRSQLSEGDAVFLVGGVVRDLFLQREPNDIDLVINANPAIVKKIARSLANTFHGAMYVLDDLRNTFRVLADDPAGKKWRIDIAHIRGETIGDDLAERDFTINAIALDVTHPDQFLQMDPFYGVDAIQQKQLALVTEQSLTNDPIRVLRGVRLMYEFDLRLSDSLFKKMTEAVQGLSKISGERFRDELFRLLETSYSASGMQLLNQLGVFQQVFLSSKFDFTESSKQIIGFLDALSVDFNQDTDDWFNTGWMKTMSELQAYLREYLSACISSDRSRLALLKIAACLKCNDDPKAGLDYLALSLHEYEFIKQITSEADHLRRIVEREKAVNKRFIYSYYKQTGQAGPGVIIFTLAASLDDNKGQLLYDHILANCYRLLQAYFIEYQSCIDPPLFLNGHDLMKLFDLQPGPAVGKLLEMLKEAQALGGVSDREEALQFIQSNLTKVKDC